MYPVTDLYKNAIVKNDRDFTCDIRIEHSKGTLNLTDVDLSQGSLTYTESSQSGDEFTIGSTVASDISFTIFNKPEYEDIQFMGATVFVSIGLFVQEAMEHFLQPSQPSRMKGFDDKWEYVPLGRFNIDDVNIKSNTIGLKAMDNMINLDKPYSLSKLSYPATLYQIYTNICSVGDIPIGTLDFPNKDYIVTERPSNDLTLRDVLGYVAELSGTFAKCDRTGRLELKWYEPTDIEISPDIRYDFIPSDYIVQIKGVMASTEDTTYLVGNEDYAIDLSENPLLQGDYENVLPNIFENIKDITFTPYTSNFKGNPAIQAGDMIVQVDKNGKEYNTLVTKMVYKYRGRSSLEAKGLPDISKGYKGSTNRKLAEIRRKIDVEVGDKLTTLEEQQLQATELIANMLGGYAIKTDDAFYIADNEDLSKAMKVWKWGLGGFGYSENGVNGPYTTAVTAEGSIVAELVSAGIITADMVKTGILQSGDGSTWINLDNGAFNFKDQIIWDGNENKIVFGSNVEMNWGNIINPPNIMSENDVTTITENTIRTGDLTADKLKVNSANIIGEIQADALKTTASINVGTDATIGNNLYVGTQSGNYPQKGIYFHQSSGNYITSNSSRMVLQHNSLLEVSARSVNFTGRGNFTVGDGTNQSIVNITLSCNYQDHGKIQLRYGGTNRLTVDSQGIDFHSSTIRNLNLDRALSVQDKASSTIGIEFRVSSNKLQYKRTNSSTWLDVA